MFVGYANLHFFQSVADVRGIQFVDANGFGVVALNRDDGYATVAVIVIQLLDALFVHLGNGAVIAGEHDNEDRAVGIVAEAVGIAINAGQCKVRGGRTQRQDRVGVLSPHGGSDQ